MPPSVDGYPLHSNGAAKCNVHHNEASHINVYKQILSKTKNGTII